jgi:uncharacterized membrane protein
MDNIFVKTLIDWLHIMATITWIGGMFTNFIVLIPVMSQSLSPVEAGKFIGAMMKRYRIVVYISIVVLGVTGIPLKIINPNYINIINFENNWEVVSFVKHICYGILVLLAVYTFEVLAPKMGKLAAAGPSPELKALQKKQAVFGGMAFLIAVVILVLSSLMRYIG